MPVKRDTYDTDSHNNKRKTTMYKLFVLTKNTFIDTLRQPVYAIIIISALLLLIISPSLAMYTISDDNKLLRELGLSTLFLTSLFIAIFSASGAMAEEIEKKTIVTVLSKPVKRPIFVLSKFLGVSFAVALAHYICSIALLMSIRNGVADSTVQRDWPLLIIAGAVIVASLLLSAFFNYSYDWKFSSTAILLAGIFATFGILFLSFIDINWQFNPQHNGINAFDIYGSLLLLLAAIVIVSIAMVFSVWFNTAVTLSACIGVFLLGLVSDYTFGRFADSHLWAKVGRFIVPNLQVFWISDAIYEGSDIPAKYIIISASYALCYILAMVSLSIALFQRRQVG